VGGKTNEDWLWFLAQLHECLGGMKPIVMSDRGNGLLARVPAVFGKENHAYCMRHVMENFLGQAAKLGIQRNASKNMLKEMFNRLAYATTKAKYDGALEELRKFKRQLAECRNEPEQWAQSKFSKERWGKLNNNPAESWNNWVRKLRPLSIPWLLTGHMQKLGQKWDKRKAEVDKLVNNVGGRIEKKLKRAYDEAESVIDVQMYNSARGEYAVHLSNSHRLVVNLSNGTCSC